jgi:hypothetical protein
MGSRFRRYGRIGSGGMGASVQGVWAARFRGSGLNSVVQEV